MNNIQFYNSFSFLRISFCRRHETNHLRDAGAPTNYIGVLLSGSARLIGEGEELTLSVGEPFLIPMGCRYHSIWHPDETGEVSWYSLGFDLIPDSGAGRPLMQKLACNSRAVAYLREMTDSLTVDAGNIGRLYLLWGEVSDQLRYTKSRIPSVAETAMRLIRSDPSRKIADIAAACGVCESGLYGVFRRTYRETPNTVRQRVLCEQAKHLLVTTDLSVEEISERLSFSSSSYFRKVMRKHTGMTPGEIRRRGQW